MKTLSDKIELIRTFPKRIEKLDVENVKEAVRLLINTVNDDWNFCKKANAEPHIHPRRILETINTIFGNKLTSEVKK